MSLTISPTLRNLVDAEITQVLPEVVAFRRDRHQHPELTWKEQATAAAVAEKLRAIPGLTVVEGVGKITGKYTSTDPANSYSAESTYTGFMGDQKLKGCKFTVAKNIATYPEGCISTDKNDYTIKRPDTVQKEERYSKYTINGVKTDISSTANVWYASGTIDVTNNDWTGTLTYTGSANPPSYVLTQDGSSTAITGKLTATASLLLTDSAKQQQMDPFRPIAKLFGLRW